MKTKIEPTNYTKEKSSSRLEKFFIDGLKDIYWAEKNLVKALPKMHKAATSEDLKQALHTHLSETEVHVTRLEKAFELLDKKAQAKKCDAMEGILTEGEHIIEDTDDNTLTRDVGIIMAAQKVEHYEIASYGGLVQIAKTLGKKDIAKLLAETLAEEKNADVLLSQIAESHVNEEAMHE